MLSIITQLIGKIGQETPKIVKDHGFAKHTSRAPVQRSKIIRWGAYERTYLCFLSGTG